MSATCGATARSARAGVEGIQELRGELKVLDNISEKWIVPIVVVDVDQRVKFLLFDDVRVVILPLINTTLNHLPGV
jgi:hypothetical protein